MAYGYKIKKEAKDWTLASVPYMEWTPRGGRRKTQTRIRQQERQRLLLSLTMATGFLAHPYGISEAAIVTKDGNTIDAVNNVYNIDPQGTNGSLSYNRFREFDLSQGHIANLKFNTDILANLVQNKITINGIVNAVKNNKLDGHLMFLSPNGMVVGATGVINAGQFTGIVPAKTDFDKLYNATNTADITLEAVTGLQQGNYAMGGTIDVSGQINTHSGIMLGAGVINIKDGAELKSTKNIDFSSLVNIGSVSAGLGNLTAVAGTGGDIILTARQESAVKDTKPVLKEDGTPEKDENGNDKTEANTIHWRDRSTNISAAVNIGTDAAAQGVSITSSDGAVKLTAESKSTYEDSTPMTLTDTLKGIVLGEDTIAESLINKLAKAESSANKYLYVNYSSKTNKSAINVGKNSTVKGNSIDIGAKSTVELKQSIAAPKTEKKDSDGKEQKSDSVLPIATVAVSRVYNNADIVLDGKLQATGKDGDGNAITIAADATTTASVKSTASGGANTSAVVGVAVLAGDTKANVAVNAPQGTDESFKAEAGKAAIKAVTNSNIAVEAGATGAGKSYVVSTVGVANYDNTAAVSVDRSIKAGAVDIAAENKVSGFKMTVDNTLKAAAANEGGKDTAQTSDEDKAKDNADAAAEQNASQSGDDNKKKSANPEKTIQDASADTTKKQAGDAQEGVQKVKDKVEGTNKSGSNEAKTSAFGLGASVGVVANKNDANIALGKNAVITATAVENGADGGVNASAKSLMTASADKEDSLQFTVKNAQANSAKVEIGAAVLVSNVKNNANILLDNEGDKSAQIKGEAISLGAVAGMGEYEKDSEKKTSSLSYAVSNEEKANKDKPATVVLDGSVGINNLQNNAVVLLGQKSQLEGSALTLSTDATTKAAGKYGGEEDNSKVGIGATVGIQNISGNSLIMAGKETVLTGALVSATANNSIDAKNEVKNAGKGDSFGISGMVALSYGDSNSIVSLDDEAAVNAPVMAMLMAVNSTTVDNSARSEFTGKESSKAFGIGVGIVNYDVNSLAMVSDNGSGISAPAGDTTDAEKAAQKIYQNATLARSVAGDTFSGKMGDATASGNKGTITTGNLSASAITLGMIQNDAKAKTVSTSAEDKAENANERKDSEKWTNWSKKGKEGANDAKKNTEDLEQDKVEAQNESAAPTIGETSQKNNASGAGKEASSAANPDETPKDDGAAPAANKSAGASIGIEGSAALTFLDGRTDAVLDNVTVKNVGDTAVESVSLSATDFLGAITTGGTDIKNSLKSGSSATKVGIGGTFAMNSSNRDVDAFLRNVNLPQVKSVQNSASKTGLEVVAGMGVSASKGNGTNVAGAGAVYYNRAEQDIHALLLDNIITSDGTGNITSKAVSTDYQIAGGLTANSASGENTNVGVGGVVAISNLETNLSSAIIGGSYQNLKSVDIEAQKGTTQIDGALAATYAGGNSGYGFEGAFAYGSVKNTTSAYISGATIVGAQDSTVNVKAGEIPVQKTEEQRSTEKGQIENNTNLTDIIKSLLKASVDADKTNKENLEDKGIDTTGKSYLDTSSASSSLDDDAKTTDEGKIVDDAAGDEDAAKDELGKNHSLTITAAMAGGWNGNAGAGAGIAYNYVKNDLAADIKGSTITADTVAGEAASDSKIISVGAGVAIGGKSFNGAGSGSWNDLKNDTKVTFENNTITGKNISEQAQNTSSIINIAGEVAGGKGMAIGLSLAYNSLNNTTGTYLKGNVITLSEDADNSVKLAAANQGKALAVAGGVDVNISQSTFGAVGTVAINRGVNNTESIVDGKENGEKTKLDKVKELSVTAEELTKKTTVAGSVSVGGKKVGIGGAVAYTSVGTDGTREKLRAEINNADITTTDAGTIEVSTKDSKTEGTNTDKSRIITVGAGFGVSWGSNLFNLQGGAAVSDIYKDSLAALNNTNINANNADSHPIINITADTKSKINTVGVGGTVDINTEVKGTAGVAINRLYQDTKAEMATDSGTTTVNAGLTQVRAAGDGDIHSVGVGGTVGVGGQVAFAGSGSYNYLANNVDAVIKNQNLTANNSIGVVAQSDDRLYNFAGGFAIGANTKAGIGAAVSINKISGNTNALVQGGSLQAADTGSIKVTRPQDENLFTTEKLDLTTDRQRLSENRKEETKSGIVVDSSAAHTIISQLASGGVAASGSVGVDLAGTVNLNTVQGNTTAKIQDAVLNAEDKHSDVNVNAVDYTNFGSFTGTPTVGVAATAGVSVGVSANWETFDRTTAAEISSNSAKKNLYAKNLTVDATAKHGSSALSFAGAVGAAATAGVASGDSIMRHSNTSTTSALLKNMNAVFDGTAEIKAEHLGNSRAMNIGASLAGGYAAVAAGAGVAVMDDASTVKAEVDSSDLKAKSSTNGKNISVLAKNENNWKNTLVTASAAVGLGAGLAANVGINNTTSETAALVTNSQLEAENVTVKAADKLVADATGGVGAAGVGGVGVSVALNNINSSVSAHVSGGSVKAAKDIAVKAEEERHFESSVTGAAVGGIGVGVNVAVTSVGKGITQAQLSNAKDENGNTTSVNNTTQNEINIHLNGSQGVNNAKGALGVDGAKFFGLSDKDSDLNAAKNAQVSLDVPKAKSDKQGVHTGVNRALLTAAENVNVTAQETNDITAKNVTVNVGGTAVGVTDAIIHTNYDTDVTVSGATITGREININALQGQKNNGSEITVTAVSVGAGLGVGVGYAGIANNGATDVNISGSTLKGVENVTVGAADESKSKTQITNVGVAALNVTTTFASVENNSNVGVTLGSDNNLAAAKTIAVDAKKANVLEAHTQGVGVGGVNVAVNHATIEDKGTAAAKITGTTNVTGTDANTRAEKFHLGAANDTTGKLSAGNTAVSLLGVSRMRGKGVMNMGAEVNVAGGSYKAKTVEFAAQLGTVNGRTLEGNVKGHNVSAVAVAPDAVVLNTEVNSKVIVNNSTFAEDADLILDNESYVDRKAYIYGVTAGAVAVGNTSADISGKATLESGLTGKNEITKVNSLQVLTYGENTGKALADAGGGGIVGYVGAHVDNESTNNVTSSLGGKWEVKGETRLLAAQKDEVRLTASEGHGGVAGVGGTSVDNRINTTTIAMVKDNTEITTDRIHVGTDNSVITGAYDDTDAKGNKDVQTYTLKDYFGGVISGNRLRSLIDLTENGTVTIGKDAKITTNKLQEYVASSQNNLTNLVQAKGGGVVAVTDAVSDLDIDVSNKVNVEQGVTLSNEKMASTEDIILAAYDDQTIKSQVDGTVYAGVISPIVAKNNIDMNRKSEVSVAGNIASSANVGLFAGANKSGVLSNLDADLKSGAYNYSVIAITVPRVNYDITADKGMVNVSGTVRSTRDINVIASGGKEEIVKDESLWNWAKGGSSTDKKFLTSDAVTAEESSDDMKKSTVNVTGSLIAGTANPINLLISGSVAGGFHYTADDNIINQRIMQGITKGTFDYANTLGDRLRELKQLIAAYDGDSTKMAAYIAERDRIQDEMERLGLVEKDAAGNVVQYLNSGRSVYYVEIPDIATSGGNINVQANDLVGTGNLHANSAPSVTITNESDAYLKLNNILMGEQGGSIIYNKDTVIPPGKTEGNVKINAINAHRTGADFNEIYGRTDSTAAGLLVQNTKTFSGGKTSTISLTPELEQEIDNSTEMSAEEKANYKQAINNGEMKYTAITDVEVNGKISNYYGNVTISNASGDIRINGGTKDRPTGVDGNTVKLIAINGTIAQDYKEGIVNINGDPEKYLADKAASMKNSLGLSDTNNDTKDKVEAYTRADSSQEATGYIAGRDVYVSAANVNVNGLIQSGYKTYAATVTEEQLAAAKTRPASQASVVQNRTMYKVNAGGAKWNDTDKVFDYVPQVYWDPSTDKLVVEDIDTQGGKVYLTGKIASTGDGRILAADGAAEISVINETSLDMNVGNVLNNQREGVITIADTAKDTWTEYKKGQTRSITGYANYLKTHAGDSDIYAGAVKSDNTLSVGSAIAYGVKDNQAYTWVNGNSVETTRTYMHYERRGMWGLVQTADEESLKGWQQSSTPIDQKEGARLGLPEGAVITQSDNVPASGILRLDGNTTKQEADRIFDRDHWVTRSGFLGWFKHIYDRWKVGTSTIQLYNYSLNASQPITIGLIGAEAGKIDIKSTNDSGGSINLTGNVANSHNAASLLVSSQAGGIFQNDGTTLKSELVNLTAKDDIKNIHITSVGAKDGNNVVDNIKLSAISTGKGDIDITAVGGVLENQSLPGNVEIVALKSQNGNTAFRSDAALGDVTLRATGNITQSGSGITVEGRGINLTSKNGGIGTANQAINLVASDLTYATDRSGAQVNADAKASIYLTEAADGGAMRVGKIESQEGDVTLTVANGGFIDALSGDDKSGSVGSVDEMVHRWIDAGLIDGEKDAQGNYIYKGAYIEGLEKNRDDYEASVTAAYDTEHGGKTQAQWLAEYTGQKSAVEDIYASAAYRNYLSNKEKYDKLSQDERQQLADNKDSAFLAYAESAEQYAPYSGYDTAEAYLQATAAYKYSQYADADTYLANDATYQDLVNRAEHPTFEWTKDMMLYAVSEKIVNSDSGSSNQTDRAANVLGRNVTLSAAKGAVGTFADQSTTVTVEELTGNDSIAKMKELMNVNAADVTVRRDESGNLLSFEIKGNMPLGVKAEGILNVVAGGNISVAGRKDAAGEHSAINVGTIDATQNNTTGDVRLHSDKGIYNANDADITNITGKNLILTGGTESIGTADKALTISLSGDLTEARANKNVFIKNGNHNDFLRLGAMFAGDTISLSSEKGFKMSTASEDIAESYINAGKKLEFTTNATEGIVGEADSAIRLLNDRATVNLAAQSAYIKGLGSLALGIQNGTLVLGNIETAGEFTAVSEGSLTEIGTITAGGNVNLEAADSLNLGGQVKAGDLENAKKELTLKAAKGNITQTDKGAITADTVKTFNGKSLLLENEDNAFNSIEVDGMETSAAEKPAIAGDVRIVNNADGLTAAVKRNVDGDIAILNLRDSGTLTNVGSLTATGEIDLLAKGVLSQGAATTFTAGKNVVLTSAGDAVQQAADAGIQADMVTVTSAKNIDLQGTGNQFAAITVQSSAGDAGIQGSVLVKDSADKLALSVQPVVNGNIEVTNAKAQGTLQVLSDMHAAGDGADVAGHITLISDGNMQLDKKLTAADSVTLTATVGDVAIGGDISTGILEPSDIDFDTGALQGTYNSLAIWAGGAVQEAAGVSITSPVVETYSGKGVSLDSEKNRFEVFLADTMTGHTEINGSIKVVTSCDESFTVGVGASVRGDAEFINFHKMGGLGILIKVVEEEDKEIKVLGGNGADGNLVLKASQDVVLLGNANAKHDIVIDSTQGGSFYGLGRGMVAGNDVKVSVGDQITYIGTIQAGHDMDMQVQQPSSDSAGIHIGALIRDTLLTAGNEADFLVNGDGTIEMLGNVEAKKDITMDVSGKGDIGIKNTITSQEESILVQVDEGDIYIGVDETPEAETVKAKKNVTIGTDLGTVYILGKTFTENGDIAMKAGKKTYQEGAEYSNFIISDDGQVLSGGGIGLYGRNGDIEITEDIQAKKSIFVSIAEQGNITFGRDISVTENVELSTEKGDITVGHIVNADNGMVHLDSGDGNVLVGKDITAGEDITISTQQGNIIVGDTGTGNDGDILAKAGNVFIQTDKGNVGIVKTVTAQAGSLSVVSGQGDILIGNNGPDVKTVTASENIDLTAEDGRIVVYGKTSTENGDISLTAHRADYIAGEENSSFIIDQNGKLEAGRALNLNVGNGDLHVSDRIQSKKDLATEIAEKGSIYFDTDVDVEGKVKVKTDEGDIYVGHDVQADGDIAMTAETGTIHVGAAVNSADGNVNLATGQGDIDIGKEVRAATGSIGIQVGTGSVTIGNNGPDVETVTAQQSIDVGVDIGQIKIYGKTSTKAGDIAMRAGAEQYTPGYTNFIIEQNGLLESGQDIYLTGRNGDLRVTDAIQAKRDLYANVLEGGSVSFDKTVTLKGQVAVNTDVGQITIEGKVDASSVNLSTQQGNITVGGEMASKSTVNLSVGTGDITVQGITADSDVSIAVQNGNIEMHDVNSAGDVTVQNTEMGSINGTDIVAAGTTHVALTRGDLFLNLAEGKAVLVKMEDNTEASQVDKILAEASGGDGPDVVLTGNYIQIGSLTAKEGDAVFQLTAMGPNNQRLIGGNFAVESLSAKNGTQMPQLWVNGGYMHVDEGNLAVNDVLAVDKFHLDNEQTDLAVYGRTPTRDGEQLVYWNNLDWAYRKARSFQLYTNGKIRTSRAVLIDAGRNYKKLYGDNLSVVDMMRERVTSSHGQFTFDSALLTEPGRFLREKMFLDTKPAEADIRRQNAGDSEIVVEQ
ncbi:hypothetical protein SAMN05216584_103125 [Selenomonas sp. WCT3]|uniref:leukotoxin LktA family filamentous adhesin n=1 Tax=Selenomonas sp. WCT3 TaxID=3158785 RepID=UPI00088E7CC9|nr:hypothetical protein SAMN05216584_103125 [Selenomonas ruminantium]